MSDYKQTDKYTWMLQQFSADFEIALDKPSSLLGLKELILSNDALFKELVDSPQKRTEKTEEVSMIFL